MYKKYWSYYSFEYLIINKLRARFTNDFLPAIQIRREIRRAVIPLLAIRSQSFLHMPRQHSCRAMYKIF